MPVRGIRPIVALACALAIAAPARARATEKDAYELFKAAVAEHDGGHFRAAAVAFEAAYRAAPRALAIYNAGVDWMAVHEDERAADDLERALDAASELTAKQSDDARARLQKLEAKLEHVSVRAPIGSRVRAREGDALPTPVDIHLAPGSRMIEIVLPDGSVTSRLIHANAGEKTSVVIDAPPPAPTAKSAPPLAADHAAIAPKSSAQRPIGWVMIGGAVALGGAAVALGVATLDARDRYDAGGDADASLHDRATTLRTLTTAAWIGAAAVGVAGVALVLTAPSSKNASARLVVDPGHVSVAARF